MHALKQAEELLGTRHVEAPPLVAQKVRGPYGVIAQHHAGALIRPNVLDGVVQQVQQHLPQQRRIAQRRWHDFAQQFILLHARCQRIGGAAGQGRQVHRRRCQVGAHHPQQLQHVADHLPHVRRRSRDALKHVTGHRPQFLTFIGNEAGKTVDGTQGCPQVVCDGIGDDLHVTHGSFEFCGALLHTLFQRRIQAPHFFLNLHIGGHIAEGAHHATVL